MNTMLGNWRTTMIGFVAAIFTYFAALGPNLPTTKADWLKALGAAVLAALGVAAKDANVGSKPGP
jgi:uncharacterized protein with PQ loop repeat